MDPRKTADTAWDQPFNGQAWHAYTEQGVVYASGLGCRAQDSGFRVQDLGFSVQRSAFSVQRSGCRVQGSGLRIQDSGFKVQGSGFRVQGSGFRVQGSGSSRNQVGLAVRRTSVARVQGAGFGGFRVEDLKA